MITTKELAWAAGFLEGEGSFGYWEALRVCASQVQKEPLERLQRMFGGTLRHRPPDHRALGGQPIWYWQINTRRSAQVMMTIYCMMSPRRQRQIEDALTAWKPARLMKVRGADVCARGHKLDETNLAVGRSGHKRCRACCELRRRRRRSGETPERVIAF